MFCYSLGEIYRQTLRGRENDETRPFLCIEICAVSSFRSEITPNSECVHLTVLSWTRELAEYRAGLQDRDLSAVLEALSLIMLLCCCLVR